MEESGVEGRKIFQISPSIWLVCEYYCMQTLFILFLLGSDTGVSTEVGAFWLRVGFDLLLDGRD